MAIGPQARNTDPDTSHEAAKHMRESAPTMRGRLAVIFSEVGSATHEELFRMYRSRYSHDALDHSIRPRVNELKKRGWVVDRGQRKLSSRGVSVIVWHWVGPEFNQSNTAVWHD